MTRTVDLIVKVGGSLAREGGLADRLSMLLDLSAESGTRLIVPGGGEFADGVRAAARRFDLGESTAHWMAVLAMDQYAHLLADVLPDGVVVFESPEIAEVLKEGGLPVLAPFRWIRRVDPLPHSWEVTGDSIAAWIAGQLGARKLILLKSEGDRTGVDAHFSKALPPGLDWETVTPESIGEGRTR